MEISPACVARSLAMQKVNPFTSSVSSSGVGSSRASARRGPCQPPAARYTRMGVFSRSAKNDSSSCRAVSLKVIIEFLRYGFTQPAALKSRTVKGEVQIHAHPAVPSNLIRTGLLEKERPHWNSAAAPVQSKYSVLVLN